MHESNLPPQQQPLGPNDKVPQREMSRAIQASKALAAIAMEGSNPWQKIIVYSCFGMILGSILVIGLPPYATSKQLSVFGGLSGNLMISVIFILHNAFGGTKGESKLKGRRRTRAIAGTKTQRSFGIAWILVIALAFTVIFGSRIIGYDPLWLLFPSWNQSMQSGFLTKGITDGITRNRDFVIEAVTLIVRIEDTSLNNRIERRSTIRTIYTLRALKRISKNDVVFTEEYLRGDGEEVIYWKGSDTQRLNSDTPTSKTFDVLFDAEKGENKTLVTGATIVSHLPLHERQDDGIRFAGNEDMAFYPNESDAVCEVNIVIESSSVPLRLTNIPSIRRIDGSIREPSSTSFSQGDSAGGTTLTGRWTDVLPGEMVGLKFSW